MSAPFSISLDDDIVGALDALAEKVNRPRDWLIERAIEDYVALNAWQVDKIERGIAAADSDDFASDAEVERVRRKYASHP